MADSKITALTSISTSTDPANDPLVIVDVSDTSMAATGTTKKVTLNQLLGASGTATLASATITGDMTVDTSTLKVDSANDRVGIGTASPAYPLDLDSTLGTVLNINSTNANGTGLRFSRSGTVNGYVGSAKYTVGGALADFSIDVAGANNLIFGVNDVEAMRLNSTGLNIANGNVILGTSGKGIDFSATPNSSGTMTSELLNDYEEGTFTPTVIGATTAGTATYASRAGYYTKIGRLVTVNIYLDWNSATGTGQMRFGGLPFTSSSSSLSFSAAYFGLVNGITLTANHILTGYTETNNTVISATSYPAGGGAYAAVPIDAAGELVITCTYMAA